MSLLRTFIAIEFPSVLQEAIYNRTAQLREAASSDSVRWVPRQNLHLTLKFLGDTSPANIQFLNQMLEIEATKFSRFQLSIGGLGAFPGTKRPRILWVGAQVPPELKALQYHLEGAAVRLGYPSEERPFSPHLTIGRVRDNAAAGDLQQLRHTLETIQIDQIGHTEVEAITLMKSDLRPGGSVYAPLFSAKLKTSEVKTEST